jgi:signal transduction histidine kinase
LNRKSTTSSPRWNTWRALLGGAARLGPLTRFTVFVAITFLVAFGAYAALASSSAPHMGLLAAVLAGSAAVSLLVGHAAHRLSLLRRSPRILWTLLAGYALVGVLTLLGVLAAALLMFINTADVRLVAVLMIFGVGLAVSFGYLLSTGLSRDARRLVEATDLVASGRFDVRVETKGQDEMADLAQAFNEMAKALAEAAGRQCALERMRLDLVAWAGHDLRTPLTSVRVIIEALADGVVSDPQTVQRYLQTAKRDIQVIGLLIDDLSLLAQVDAGGLQLTEDMDSLGRLVSELADSFSPQTQQKNVLLVKDVDPGMSEYVFDTLQMRRALSNLLDNAVRHAPEGGTVQVGARSTPEAAVVEVWNDGPPVDPEDLPRLFDRFYRGDKSRSRSTGKAGLGLAIAKAIVEAHGGTITAESGPDMGTRFRVTLPPAPRHTN